MENKDTIRRNFSGCKPSKKRHLASSKLNWFLYKKRRSTGYPRYTEYPKVKVKKLAKMIQSRLG